MSPEDIENYDVGSKVHPRFIEQQLQSITKPLLKDVIGVAELAYPLIRYNIKI